MKDINILYSLMKENIDFINLTKMKIDLRQWLNIRNDLLRDFWL